jgi:hypothetical protein
VCRRLKIAFDPSIGARDSAGGRALASRWFALLGAHR